MKTIHTEKAPAAIGPYSQAIVSGGLVYSAGQTPLVPETGLMITGDIKEQTEQSIKNVAAILEAAGSGLGKVVKTTCFLTDMNDFAAFNEVYAAYFTGKPARSTVAVKQLPRNALVEIEAIAEL
jgi:2-iminobutanoate/2-iminopropanoate deaminase